MTNQPGIKVGVWALALAIACTMAWSVYKVAQKRMLEREVVALAQDSTARMREALGLLAAGPEARPQLEADFSAVEDNIGKTQALAASVNPKLVQAAERYATDAQTLLRRELALHAARDAVHLSIGEINSHLRAAGARSPAWISQALALKQRLEKSFFDYRLAAGGLEKSFHYLSDTGRKLQSFVPSVAVIEESQIAAMKKRLLELSAQLEQEVDKARRLPVG